MEEKIIESIAYTLPAIVTGAIAYYMFKEFINNHNSDRKLDLLMEKRKDSLPLKLQAYERLLLFCERINPLKMLIRIQPLSTNTNEYLQLLIGNIEQEFEHNLVQQIYISDDSWTAIYAAKTAVIRKLKQVAEISESANEMRENLLINYSKNIPPTETAIDFIKNEVKKLL